MIELKYKQANSHQGQAYRQAVATIDNKKNSVF